MRVLVIDDNSDDRQLVLRELTALWPGVIAIEVNDLATFEAALEARPADLVVTDLDLRWANGRDIFVATKKLYPACPVVMFTGTGDETIAVELMRPASTIMSSSLSGKCRGFAHRFEWRSRSRRHATR